MKTSFKIGGTAQAVSAATMGLLVSGLLVMGLAGEAMAQAGIPHAGQFGLSEPASPIMHEIRFFHDYILLPVIMVIALLVLSLLVYVGLRFRKSVNPTASRNSHNTLIEVLWTVIPILILVVIAIPSFRLLYFQRTIPPAEITIKATGNQWYWSYEYPDVKTNGGEALNFISNMVEDADLKPGQPRLLAVDNEVVVPAGKVVKMLVTASDVIHDWAIPSFGMKIDGIPGRNNEAWFMAERPGIYYGQCSELCGVRHAFMPIAVRAVPQADYDAWTEKARTAGLEEANKMLAAMIAANARLAAAGPAKTEQ